MSHTPTYRAWESMIGRCENSGSSNFKYYGGRGIRVCSRWRDSFENFLADMGERPEGRKGKLALFSIERRDNNGDYDPKNCIWATMKQQAQNKRMLFHGETCVKCDLPMRSDCRVDRHVGCR